MASLRATLFNFFLRRTVKSKPLHLQDPVILREAVDERAVKTPPDGVTLDYEDSEVRGEWHRVEADAGGRLIYYLHGGGYVFGSPKSHRSITFALAKETPADVFSLEYRRAPEDPFPAAVEDAVAGYRWLLRKGRAPASISFAGDSAGGGLAMALLLACKKQGLPLPGCVVLYSPWTDLTVSGDSIDDNEETDVMFKAEYIREGVKLYLGDANPNLPLVSPLFGDLTGLPPVFIFASKSEALFHDSERMVEKLRAAGVETMFEAQEGLAHVWPVFTPWFPEAKQAVLDSAAFIREHIRAKENA